MRRSTRPSPALAIACLALFVALGGTGYAASGAIDAGGDPTAAAATHGRRHRRVLRGPRGFRGFRGAPGATGPQGPAGPQGPQGLQGAHGSARAFAEVTARGTIVAGHALNITNAMITNPRAGVYCFLLTSIGITRANSLPIASLDWSESDTNPGDDIFVVPYYSYNEDCPAATIGVRTFDVNGSPSQAGFTIAFM